MDPLVRTKGFSAEKKVPRVFGTKGFEGGPRGWTRGAGSKDFGVGAKGSMRAGARVQGVLETHFIRKKQRFPLVEVQGIQKKFACGAR